MKKICLLTFLFFSIGYFNYLEAHPGIGIVMDSKGNVFYTDLTHVWKITPNGRLSIAVEDVHTHELFIDQEDNLFGEHVWYEGEATDKWGHYIWCLKHNGELVLVKNRTEGFPENNTLKRDSDGASYWIEKVRDGEVIKRQSIQGTSSLHSKHQFEDIRWVHVPRCAKDLYVIDLLKLKKVAPNGKVTVVSDKLKEKTSPFASVGDHHYLMGPWTDDNENVYVAVFGGRKVKKITVDGSVTTVYESPKGWSPSGGMVASDGSLWILEFSNRNKARVVNMGKDGAKRVFKPSN